MVIETLNRYLGNFKEYFPVRARSLDDFIGFAKSGGVETVVAKLEREVSAFDYFLGRISSDSRVVTQYPSRVVGSEVVWSEEKVRVIYAVAFTASQTGKRPIRFRKGLISQIETIDGKRFPWPGMNLLAHIDYTRDRLGHISQEIPGVKTMIIGDDGKVIDDEAYERIKAEYQQIFREDRTKAEENLKPIQKFWEEVEGELRRIARPDQLNNLTLRSQAYHTIVKRDQERRRCEGIN